MFEVADFDYVGMSYQIAALRKQVKKLERALRFYAGRKRADGNGYEFDEENFRGAKARRAIGGGA